MQRNVGSGISVGIGLVDLVLARCVYNLALFTSDRADAMAKSGTDAAQTPMAQEFLAALGEAQRQMGYNGLSHEELTALQRLAKRAGFKLIDPEGFSVDPKKKSGDSPKERPMSSGFAGPSAGSGGNGGMSEAAKRRAPSASSASDGTDGSDSYEVVEDKVTNYFTPLENLTLPKGVLSLEQWSMTEITMPRFRGQSFHELTVGSLGHHDEWQEEKKYLSWLHATYSERAREQLVRSGEFSSQAYDLANYLDAIQWRKEVSAKGRYERTFK